MASSDTQGFRSDLPEKPVAYPGKAIKPPPLSAPEGGLVEEKPSDEFKLAKMAGVKSVASIRYQDKNIHVVPVKNLRVRDLKPVGYTGSVLLPIRGERVFELGQDIRKPLEQRLSRLTKSFDANQILEALEETDSKHLQVAGTTGKPTDTVKTELDRLKELARKELTKKNAARPKISPTEHGVAPVREQLRPTAEPAKPSPPQLEVGTIQKNITEALESATVKNRGLLSDAKRLESELSDLQKQIAAQQAEPKTKRPSPAPQKESSYTAQLNQLIADKTAFLNKINELTIGHQQESEKRKAAETQLAGITSNLNEQLQRLQMQNSSFLQKIQSLEREKATHELRGREKEKVAKELETLKAQLRETQVEKKSFGGQVHKLQTLLGDVKVSERKYEGGEKRIIKPKEEVIKRGEPSARIVKPQKAFGRMAPALTTAPNVINGIVKDDKGHLLPNMIIVVKDEKGDPVRALKTNKIGQFAISTPLPNGVYNMEIESTEHNFDIVQIEVKGDVLPPIEIGANT